MKTIVEVYPNKQYIHTMPDGVFEVLVGAYAQAAAIRARMTMTSIIHHLPIELKIKVRTTVINHIDKFDYSYQKDADSVIFNDANDLL